jgi:hypothetical protein
VKDTGPGRINTLIGVGSWEVEDTWTDPTGSLCECVRKQAANIRNRKLPYKAVPGNNCDGKPTCNSNYTTHCIMSSCGISTSNVSGSWEPGWNHRMKECVAKFQTERCACHCFKWTEVDSGWCADTPNPPKLKPDPKPQQPNVNILIPYHGPLPVPGWVR